MPLKKGPSGDLDFGSDNKGSASNDHDAPRAFGAEEDAQEAEALDNTFMSNVSADGMNTSGPKNPPAPAEQRPIGQFDQPLANF